MMENYICQELAVREELFAKDQVPGILRDKVLKNSSAISSNCQCTMVQMNCHTAT